MPAFFKQVIFHRDAVVCQGLHQQNGILAGYGRVCEGTSHESRWHGIGNLSFQRKAVL